MKIRNTLFAAVISVLTFYSCSTDDEGDGIIDDRSAVQFNSRISGEPQTMAIGSTWSPNDRIGVYMKSAGQPLSTTSILEGVDNRIFSTTGNGIFKPATDDQRFFYPKNTSVDFIAYYPQQSSISSFVYKVNTTNQASQEDLDLLYSNNVTNVSSGNPSLSFKRQMAKIQLNITAGDGITNLDGLVVTISGTKTQADFNLVDGTLTVNNSSVSDISPKITLSGTTALGEATVIPDNGGNGRTISFTLPSVGTFKWDIPSSVTFEKGKRYKYDVILKDKEVKPSYGWIETPLYTLTDETMYVSHDLPDRAGRNYSMLFDTKYKIAYWVAYPLHTSHIGSGRHENWTYDPLIPQSFQANLSSSYKESYLDRGHQIPNADRNYSVAGSRSTFYFSNMTPQYNKLNQGIWASLEEKVRSWTGNCDTMYVVTGAMLTTKTDFQIDYARDAKNQPVGKPKYFYKALAQRVGNTYYTAAFKFDNVAPPSNPSLINYRMTVKELEELTGFTFFPALSAEDKSKIVASKWN